MYARLTRFEGADPSALEQDLEEMRKQMHTGMTDESINAMAEQVKGRFERAQVESALKSIKRVLMLADREKGSSAMLVFCDTEDDVRRVDELFDQMSPGDEGGKRQSVDIYEVAIENEPQG